MLNKIKERLRSHSVNLKGWKSKRQIVVLESDDWGSVRMPSAEAYRELLNYGVKVDKCPYNMFDKLESGQDLEALFEALSSVKDSAGKPAILTANSIVANPDFAKIAASGFERYYYEPVTETYNAYYPGVNMMGLIAQGHQTGVYKAQYHGREHLNVRYWMQALKNNMPETRFAFAQSLFGISKTITTEKRSSFLSAYNLERYEEIEDHKKIIIDGLNLFEQQFGFRSLSFIAPNYTWHSGLEPALKANGVEIIQGARAQQAPSENGIAVKKHVLGSFNTCGQVYLIRNVQFEPTGKPGVNWVEKAMQDVSIAFFHQKPAIISTHRLNFMGGMAEKNRTDNLRQLVTLLSGIVKKYPNVEFMSSDQLGSLIISEKGK